MGILGSIFGKKAERKWNRSTPDFPKVRIRRRRSKPKPKPKRRRRPSKNTNRKQGGSILKRVERSWNRSTPDIPKIRFGGGGGGGSRSRSRSRDRDRDEPERRRTPKKKPVSASALASVGKVWNDITPDVNFGGGGRDRQRRQRQQRRVEPRSAEAERRQKEPVSARRKRITRENSYTGAFVDSIVRSAQATAATVHGTGEAGYNLATDREDIGDVARGAGQQGLRLSNTAGHNIVDVFTGGRAEEIRENYRTDAESRQQYERSQRNVQRNRDPLGQIGAVLEVGTDFALDQPGASVQNRAADAAGGRENIARRYGQAATAVDEGILGRVGISTQQSQVSKALADFFVTPAVKGVATVTTGTDVETGEKENATGDDIVETALTPFAFVGGGLASAGARGARGGARAAQRGARASVSRFPRSAQTASAAQAARRGEQASDVARAASRSRVGSGRVGAATAAAGGISAVMANPIRIISGILRRGDSAASGSRTVRRSTRTVRSSDNLPVLRDTTRRLNNAPTRNAAPRRVEQARQTRRGTESGTPRLIGGPDDNLPVLRQSGDATRRTQQSTRFAGGSDVIDLTPGPGGVFRTAEANADAVRAASRSRQAAQSGDEVGGILDRIRSVIPTSGAAATGARAARSGDEAAESGGIFSRLRQAVGRGDEGAQARRPRSADEANRASDARTADRAEQSRRADEANRARSAERAAQSRRADEAAEARRAERTADAARGGRRGGRLDDIPVLGGVVRWMRRNPLATVGGGIVGGAYLAEGLLEPDQRVEGDGWYAERRRSYNVQTRNGPQTIYSYEVFADGGNSIGYTVILGQDAEGRIYYLGGSPERPSESRSRVTTTGLQRAQERRAEAAAGRGGGA